ncbi:hypothetical protein MCP_0960 [Methanocella paludicola SANAE]|uniref:Uncharacterized protein n=1 Tax=Methanocella paludicola (strain DSM 17711 / JCM 13418 / NBRC 101707 / SANAE) TaxID=304371 RepID=D1YX60_METPS|nr:hypothetical protein [Methanocella paludicola]BAI61032.1 hypothetical protein MCP_0960 [Methanocella paludicola SANAE]
MLEPKKSGKEKLAEGIIALAVLIVIASVVLPLISPALCCTLPVLLPLLWAGYIYQQWEDKLKKKPPMPPEQML